MRPTIARYGDMPGGTCLGLHVLKVAYIIFIYRQSLREQFYFTLANGKELIGVFCVQNLWWGDKSGTRQRGVIQYSASRLVNSWKLKITSM